MKYRCLFFILFHFLFSITFLVLLPKITFAQTQTCTGTTYWTDQVCQTDSNNLFYCSYSPKSAPCSLSYGTGSVLSCIAASQPKTCAVSADRTGCVNSSSND